MVLLPYVTHAPFHHCRRSGHSACSPPCGARPFCRSRAKRLLGPASQDPGDIEVQAKLGARWFALSVPGAARGDCALQDTGIKAREVVSTMMSIDLFLAFSMRLVQAWVVSCRVLCNQMERLPSCYWMSWTRCEPASQRWAREDFTALVISSLPFCPPWVPRYMYIALKASHIALFNHRRGTCSSPSQSRILAPAKYEFGSFT